MLDPYDNDSILCLCCEEPIPKPLELNAVLIDGEWYCNECAELPMADPLPEKPHEIDGREFEKIGPERYRAKL